MKKQGINEITLVQYTFLIHGMQIGVGMLSLPSALAEKGGTDGWIALFVGWLASLTASILIIQLMKRYPDCTLPELLSRIMGKWAGKAAYLFFGLYYALFAYTVLARMSLHIESWILQQSNASIFFLLFCIPTYMIARKGLRILGRYAEFIFLFSLWMLYMFLLPLREAHWLHILPILKDGMLPVVDAIPSTLLSFLGFEAAFFFYAGLNKKKHAVKGMVIANTLTLLVYVMVTIVCFVFFSPDDISSYHEPVISLLKVIEFRFVERVDIIVFSGYLLIVSTTWIPSIHIATSCASQLFGSRKFTRTLLILLGIGCIIVFGHGPTFIKNNELIKLLNIYGFIAAFALPLLLWLLVAALRLRKGGLTP
ncbi:GerAB/ArcD/ProY family transporter [Paenibacillus sp. PL2-23]|uniref:GerAB/ArcD/ProY family transporter n=1 Tax=Paenibacillus sp. PL2-23 TaxID=2100729 RepID=UPI0030F6322E